MKLLLIGGTVFLGRALVEAALARGHTLTLFNRGRSNPELFPQVEKLTGDRKVDLSALAGRRWDAVIDTCGYVPRVVRQSAQMLSGQVERYTFVSSLSVYANPSQPGIDENAPVSRLEDETQEEVTGETYGPLKALCEMEVESAFPGRALIVRPGLIVGPHDPTDRFTYWPWRVDQGGETLAPGRPERGVQWIDVRDLAEWMVRMIEAGGHGVYNANGPEAPLSMEALLDACRAAAGSGARFTWVDDAFLLEQGVEPWMELPLWIPESSPDSGGFFAFSSKKAIREGLTFRPALETARATLECARTRPVDYHWRAGLDREKEAAILAAWRR